MSLDNMFSSTCRIRVAGAFDQWGKSTGFTPGPAFTCRFDPKDDEIVTNNKGEDVRISGFVYLLAANAPDPSDELEVDGDDYRIIKIELQRGFSSAHHAKIAVRKT